MKNSLLCWVLMAMALPGAVQTQAALSEERAKELQRLADGIRYQQGTISLKGDVATVNVGQNFRYVGPADAETVLTKIWGNPPGQHTLGMLFPEKTTPLDDDGWAVVITYDEDGYVKDDDAAGMDYDKLLKQMQDGVKASSEEREKQGYPGIELVNWAQPPHYDRSTHKLYWAKELKFGDNAEHTLNYCIRALGRRGVLQLNVVGTMAQLAEVEKAAPSIISMVDFKEGNRYTDFNSKTDKVAEYGIAALIAGAVLAKTGLLAKLLVGLLALKKVIIVGVVAVISFIKRLFGGGKPKNDELRQA